MRRIDLPSGGWAEVFEAELTHGRRKPLLRRAMGMASGNTPAGAELLDWMDDLIVAFVVAWSFGPTPHEDAAALDAVSGPDYDAIVAAVMPLVGSMMGGIAGGASPDPKAVADMAAALSTVPDSSTSTPAEMSPSVPA
ncbi:MAG: hypothetical protein M3Y26_01340 [Actinomycetota bacterium]|nr:hypothetical protein [Actinomycetota bacterium]